MVDAVPVETPREIRPARSPLQRVPLKLRMVVYCAGFLSVVLVLLPLAARQLDAWLPAWQFTLPAPLRIVGGLLLFALLAIYLGCSYVLSTRGRGAYVEFDPPSAFVCDGPFRFCRNPIAACVVGMLGALALVWSSIGVLLLFLLAVPLAHLQVVLLEEPLLRKRFGQPYEQYLRSVPRWLPRPWR